MRMRRKTNDELETDGDLVAGSVVDVLGSVDDDLIVCGSSVSDDRTEMLEKLENSQPR